MIMANTERRKMAAIVGSRDFVPCEIPLHELEMPLATEVHVWHLDLCSLARSLQGALGGKEDQDENLTFTAGQLRFARRFYLRLLLGAYLGLPGKSVKINRSNRGKPVLDSSVHDNGLHFSVAKSEGRLLIGFSTSGPVGVDLEPSRRQAKNAMGVARRYFSTAEAISLAAMAPDELDEAFLRTWACKEAVVKASGLGIANQLCRFTVETELSLPVTVLEFEGEDVRNWSLGLVEPEEMFLGAVAARKGSMKIRAFRLLPARQTAE